MSETLEFLNSARLVVGESDLLAPSRADATEMGEDADAARRLDRAVASVLTDFRIRVGTLLRADNVSVLLGAGASVSAGGPLLGSVPLSLERSLVADGIGDDDQVEEWLTLFYSAVRAMNPGCTVPDTADAMKARHVGEQPSLPVNLESLLVLLNSWRATLECNFGRLTLSEGGELTTTKDILDETIAKVTGGLSKLCDLPSAGSDYKLDTHKRFLKRLLLRPLNLKRASIFTLNYDCLVEKAADFEGIVLVDGFVGVQRRTFRPESYDQDLYFPAETTEGRVSRLDRVLHLHKLHGSVSWQTAEPDMSNPYGVSSVQGVAEAGHTLIYPTPTKYADTLGMPYAELFRRFARAVVRPQSMLLVVGYGFGDEHVNAIIRQALAVPSFTLVIVDPSAPEPDASGGFVARLRHQRDPRVWVVGGSELGTFEHFVNKLMPDLQDEEMLERVMATRRAISTPPRIIDEVVDIE